MIIPLVQALGYNPRLFQEILFYLGSFYYALLVEMNVDVLAETGGVVVSDGFRIAES